MQYYTFSSAYPAQAGVLKSQRGSVLDVKDNLAVA